MEDRHHIFLTGRLARPRLEKILFGLADPGFTFEVRDIGVKVAALMTEPIIKRRLEAPVNASAVYVPGRTRMDLTSLSHHFGVPFLRGPDEINDLPPFFGKAESISTSASTTSGLCRDRRCPGAQHRAASRALAPWPRHRPTSSISAVSPVFLPPSRRCDQRLKQEGFKVSVDSGDFGELERGAHAGADALLSLTRETLALARDTGIEAVLVPSRHGDLDSSSRQSTRRHNGASGSWPIRCSIPFISASPTLLRRYARCGRVPTRRC